MTDNTTDTPAPTTDRRLVHWLRAVDRLIHERFADAFAEDEPASREAARARAASVARELRERIDGAVSPDDYATTIASLEAVARALGWDDTAAEFGHGFGPRHGRRGFGPHGMRGFGPHLRHGFGHGRRFRPGFGPGWDAPRPEAAHEAESSYERGFEAGLRAANRG